MAVKNSLERIKNLQYQNLIKLHYFYSKNSNKKFQGHVNVSKTFDMNKSIFMQNIAIRSINIFMTHGLN